MNDYQQPTDQIRPKRRKRYQPLTQKQRKLIKSVSQGAGITKAARTAGYASPQAASISLKRLEHRIPSIMDRYGITEKFLLNRCLKPGLTATKTEFFQRDGVVTDQREVIAWGARHDYLNTALKLRGMLSGEESNKGNTMVMVLDWKTDAQPREASVPVPAPTDVTPT